MPYLTEENFRVAQCVMLAPGAIAMLTDCLHGRVSKVLLGYRNLFPTAVGIWKTLIIAANLAEGGKHALIGQRLISVLMGGVVFHHVVAEGQPTQMGAGLVFLALSAVIPVLRNELVLREAVMGSVLLSAVGYGIGVLAFAGKGDTGK